MRKDEFKDRLFDILNETDNLPVQDIAVKDAEDQMTVYLKDGSMFAVRCEYSGNWWILDGKRDKKGRITDGDSQ